MSHTGRAFDMSDPDKRIAPRHPASDFPAISGVRISPQGTRATLINISAKGVLVESSASLKPTSAVTIVFEGTFTPSSVPSRVVRTTVVGIGKDGGLKYQIGIAFTAPIALEERPAGDAAQVPVVDPPAAPAIGPPSAVVHNRW
jgi:hypothetical protein